MTTKVYPALCLGCGELRFVSLANTRHSCGSNEHCFVFVRESESIWQAYQRLKMKVALDFIRSEHLLTRRWMRDFITPEHNGELTNQNTKERTA